MRSKTHEPVSFERSEFTGECAELPTKSRRLSTASRHRCVEVAAPYMLRVNKFVQISRADDIRSYCELFHYSILLITLNEVKQTHQSLCDSSPSGAPEYIP